MKSGVHLSDASTSVSARISTSPAQNALPRLRRHFLCVSLSIAGLANVLVPAVYFSETRLFGYPDLRYRALLAILVVAEYAITFWLLLLHVDAGFASGYAVATAAIVTAGSAMLAYSILYSSGLGWTALYLETLILGGFAFAVLSNATFLVASIRYASAIHPRLHRGGFFLGIIVSLALLFLYARIALIASSNLR
jgi:hypothetical protein